MNILIVEDHPLVREGLKKILASTFGGLHIEETGDGESAIIMITKSKYDLVILDISLPGISGVEVLQQIKHLGKMPKVLVMSIYPPEQYAMQMLAMGASGYISKNSPNSELVYAISKICSGGRYMSPQLIEKQAFNNGLGFNPSSHNVLSKREFHVMLMIARGNSLKEIAGKLYISDKTVSTYRHRIIEKMEWKNNAELIHYVSRNGLLQE